MLEMKLIYLLCVLLAFAYYAECKKGGGGGRVGGKGGWFWRSNNKKTHSSSNKKHHNSQPEPPPKQSQPSAPHPEPSFKKETAGVQQSSFQKNSQPHQTPVGWNVPGTNQNNPWKNTAYQQHGAPGGYHPQGGWPSSGAGYHGYPQQHGGAWGNGYHGSPGGAWGGGYHGAPGGYHGFSNGHSGYPQNSYGGFGGYHPSSSYGGFGGGFGGFGGNRGGFGGYGGMGGFGGPMVIQKKSGFGSTFGNILTGMAIYSLGSSLLGGMFRRPYNVYNYHNQPEKREEIQMPSNILTICEGNATSFCIKGTTAICTSNGTVLCVATMSNTSPCGEGGALCINTTVPCVDKSDPLCQNATKQQEEIPINLPCFTNLTVDVNLLHEEGPANANHKYCVTTMAIAGPEYKNCSQDGKKAVEGYRSVLEGTFNWSIIVENIKRPYIVYNFEHPTEASAGDIVMPLQVLAPCIDNATNLCAPGLTPVCTSFAEVMCLEVSSSLSYCDAYNTTCFQSTIPCVGDDDDLCKNATTSEETEETANKTEITLDLPCFTNITINSNLPNFDIHNFNGTIPQGSPTSFMYHYHFCVITLALPSAETEVCIM